jgi:predicted small secreted protein
MRNRLIAATALFAFTLAGCTTVSVAANPISKTWVGRSAGEFFAKYNPPLSDTDSGSSTIYNWRGGYKRIKLQTGRSASVSCSAKLTVSDSYVIRDITITADRPGANGPSYCEELLAGQ